MWRGLISTALIYASGHPGLDGYRPAWLDRPVQAFYQNINTAVHDGRNALDALNDSPPARCLRGYLVRFHDELRNS